MPQDTLSQIAELESKILQLRSAQITELQDQLKAARQTVAALEAEIAKLTGKAPVATKPERRKRTSPEDVKSGILKALAAAPTGLSQKEISDASGLNYQTVVLFLKNNPKNFKTTGKLKSKRYFLK
ncbi:MAG: hypothetical protein WCP06_10245 [Verrucomicrobiota bacterium]